MQVHFLCLLSGSCHRRDLSSTMVLTHDAGENQGLQDLFLQLLKLTCSPCFIFYNLAYVYSLFQTREALFIHFMSGSAQSKLRG